MNRKDLVIIPRILLSHIPVWEFVEDSGTRGEYAEDNRIQLEVAFLERTPKTLAFEDNGISVLANLKTMKHEVLLEGVPGPVHSIERIDSKALDAPARLPDGALSIVPAGSIPGAEGKRKKKIRRRRTDKKDGKKHDRKKKRRRESSSYSDSYSDSYSSDGKKDKKKKSGRRRRTVQKHKTGGATAGADRQMQMLGNYGTGDNNADIEKFICDNKLDDRTVDALSALDERQQKAVMGTDGGQNTFQLDGKVNNPNAVVMSRIRKMKG